MPDASEIIGKIDEGTVSEAELWWFVQAHVGVSRTDQTQVALDQGLHYLFQSILKKMEKLESELRDCDKCIDARRDQLTKELAAAKDKIDQLENLPNDDCHDECNLLSDHEVVKEGLEAELGACEARLASIKTAIDKYEEPFKQTLLGKVGWDEIKSLLGPPNVSFAGNGVRCTKCYEYSGATVGGLCRKCRGTPAPNEKEGTQHENPRAPRAPKVLRENVGNGKAGAPPRDAKCMFYNDKPYASDDGITYGIGCQNPDHSDICDGYDDQCCCFAMRGMSEGGKPSQEKEEKQE